MTEGLATVGRYDFAGTLPLGMFPLPSVYGNSDDCCAAHSFRLPDLRRLQR
jgi:hypothetical protein